MSDVRVPDLNNVTIAGRLTRDPELKYIASGRAVCRVSIANAQRYKDKEGEWKENTTFVDATVWDKQAEYVGEKLRKGRPVIVEGRLKSNSWEDQATGQKRTKIEIAAHRITPLDWEPKGDGGETDSRDRGGSGGSSARYEREAGSDYEEPIPEEDIPF